MKTRLHLITLFAAAVALAGCSIEPPLFLRSFTAVQVQIETKVDIDIMWQVNWEAAWQFDWNVAAFGPVGYTTPAGVRMHIFTQDADGLPTSHTVHNFSGKTARMDIFEGTHNLLFHNNDSESLQFRSESDLADIYSFTRNISTGLRNSEAVYTTQQKAAGLTKAGEIEEEPVSLPPDGLFSVYEKDRIITSNPEDYILENGRYVLRIESLLQPLTYIYLFQVRLLNNDGRIVGSEGGAAITAMADGVNLMSRVSNPTTVSVPMNVYFDRDKQLMGARVFTFGLPGCNPYNEASVAAAPKKTHYFVLSVSYINGSYCNVRIDITDAIRALPLGGVITLDLDVNDFPPGAGGEGGFNALIDGWDDETGYIEIS